MKRILSNLFLYLLLASLANAQFGITALSSNPVPRYMGGIGDDVSPLTELGSMTYLGFEGGLYPSSRNVMPADHAARGEAAAHAMQPLDLNGQPDRNGKYVMLGIGMSHATTEFCHKGRQMLPCQEGTFMDRARNDLSVEQSHLVILDGAQGAQHALYWTSGTIPGNRRQPNNYDVVRDKVLAPAGVSEKQVQIVWLKQANSTPTVSLPNPAADAYRLETYLGEIVRTLKSRYPNLQQVFLSSRSYAGYATMGLNPEPQAYESGFAVKWLIEAQIKQMRTGVIDGRAGDLNSDTVAPWIGWGPYLWANGTTPRTKDGLTWWKTDFDPADYTHPSIPQGQQKAGHLIFEFFKTSPQASSWFLAGGD